MAYRTDLFFDNRYNQVIDPVVITLDTDSSSVDMQGYGDLTAVVNLGTSADVLSPTDSISLALQQSNDNSTWINVPTNFLTNFVSSNPLVNQGQFAFIDDNAETNQVYIVGYKGYDRFLRIQIRMNGTHASGIPVSAMLLQGFADQAPVNEGV